MFRTVSQRLLTWLAHPERRPLVLRGARQVGKTWLVRDLAQRAELDLVELNFERDPSLVRAFSSRDPRRSLDTLSVVLGRPVRPGSSLLFLDEVQAVPELLAQLRWFYEEIPQLPVVAAGSLLEFTLADHAVSMPVGRVSFEHVEPMGFDEYLLAHGQDALLDVLRSWRPTDELDGLLHDRALAWFDRYAMVGGMPAVVQADVAGREPGDCRRLQADLMAAYRADFAKYAGRLDHRLLDEVLVASVHAVGRKFVYSQVGEGVKQHQAKAAVERLAQARLCHLVPHTSANGLPLAAEASDRARKALLLDVGLVHALLRTPARQAFPALSDLTAGLRGQLAEQLVGQQLRLAQDPHGDGPALYWWQRGGGRAGEIDYLVELGARVVPVEVKAGAAGGMKSLHQFMWEKSLDLAVRCDRNPPSVMTVDVATTTGHPVRYRLVNLPGTLVWNLSPILEAL